MIRKKFKDIELSMLGMGNMRLPLHDHDDASTIDKEKSQAIIDYAMAHGINYYDTAYVYHGGKSEVFVGKALSKYPRESFHVATKFLIGANPDYKAVFEEQLQRLNMDYIDFYLLHAVNGHSAQEYIDSGCIDYFLEQKAAGRIKYLGFSAHAKPEDLEKFANLLDWDFAQIQLNYYDWEFSTAKEEYEILTAKNIPVIVMEPVRGGRLATLSDDASAVLKEACPDRTVPSWAFRWLMGLDNVQVVLSGMSNMEQMMDNVQTFAEPAPLSTEENEALKKALELFYHELVVPCTGCRYCVDDCPMRIDIPHVLEIYNRFRTHGGGLHRIKNIEEGRRPMDCIGCGACANHCPQNIDIPGIMEKITERLS